MKTKNMRHVKSKGKKASKAKIPRLNTNQTPARGPDKKTNLVPNHGYAGPEDQHDIDDDPGPSKLEDDKDTPGWTNMCCKKLQILVQKARGAATKPVVDFIHKHLNGTKLILVMGKSGTGKTTMIKELTGHDLKVGNDLTSGTLQYSVTPATLHGEQYIFVDTPGFGASDLDDMSVFKEIMSCLTALSPFVTIAGVLYVYGPPLTRIGVEDKRTMQWIECFCGPQFFHKITLVTTLWDQYGEKAFKGACDRFQKLKNDDDINRILKPPRPYFGASTYHHGLPQGEIQGQDSDQLHSCILSPESHSKERGEELRNLIQRRYGSSEPCELQILHEMKKMPVSETQAATVLMSGLTKTEIDISTGFALCNVSTEPSAPATAQAPTMLVQDNKMEIMISNSEPDTTACTGKTKTLGQEDKKKKPVDECQQALPRRDSDATKESRKNSDATKQKQSQKQDEASWTDSLLGWLVLAKQLASYFMKARSQSSQPGRTNPTPEWRPWDALRKWATGS